MPNAGPRATDALIQALLDQGQSLEVREEAAHSLAYSQYVRAIPPLLSVINEPHLWIRFWAVCALGFRRPTYDSYKKGPEVMAALEDKLSDDEVAPTWWAVGREALSSLAKLDRRYREVAEAEAARIRQDVEASEADRRWAECWRGGVSG